MVSSLPLRVNILGKNSPVGKSVGYRSKAAREQSLGMKKSPTGPPPHTSHSLQPGEHIHVLSPGTWNTVSARQC